MLVPWLFRWLAGRDCCCRRSSVPPPVRRPRRFPAWDWIPAPAGLPAEDPGWIAAEGFLNTDLGTIFLSVDGMVTQPNNKFRNYFARNEQ